MKKVYLVSTLMLSLLFYSCQKNESNFQTLNRSINTDRELIETYSSIDQIHYDGLDYVYERLKERNTLDGITSNEINQLAVNFTSERLQVKDVDFNYFAYEADDLSDYNLSFSDNVATKVNSHGSGTYNKAVDELNQIISNNVLDKEIYDEFVSRQVSLLEDENEKIQIIAMGYTAYSSARYWNENLDKWKELFPNQQYARGEEGPGPSTPNHPCSASIILISDAAGAGAGVVRGALTGAAGGTVALPGIGTVAGVTAGAMVGGAVGAIHASVGGALHCLLIKWLS